MHKNTYTIPIGGQGCELRVKLKAQQGTRITIKGHEEGSPLIVFFNRSKTIKRSELLRIPMPIAPQSLECTIESSHPIQIQHVGVHAIDRLKKKKVKINAPTADFIEHIISFVKEAGYLEAGYTYADNYNRYPIHYLDGLYTNGVRANTPARVDHNTGEIDVDALICRGMPIPSLFLMLLHEWGHYHLSTKSEQKADAFALDIYLTMGFSQTQAVTTYTHLFYDSPEMVKRVEKIFKKVKKYKY